MPERRIVARRRGTVQTEDPRAALRELGRTTTKTASRLTTNHYSIRKWSALGSGVCAPFQSARAEGDYELGGSLAQVSQRLRGSLDGRVRRHFWLRCRWRRDSRF